MSNNSLLVSSLTDMVSCYNDSNSNDNQLYEAIENRVISLCYNYPQLYFRLKKEDASDFVLFLHSALPGIIRKFNPSYGDFEAYFYSVLKLQVKSFYSKKNKKDRIQELLEIAQYHDMYSGDCIVVCQNTDNADLRALTNLQDVLSMSKPSKRKFFTLFLSLTPFMDVNEISTICNQLKIDFNQTMKLVEKVSNLCTKEYDRLEKMRSKRSWYYYQYLQHSDTDLDDKAQKSLEGLSKKNNEIANYQKRASYQAVSEVLHISKGTIANYQYYSRNILSWVLEPQSPSYNQNNLGLAKDVYEYIFTNRHSIKPDSESEDDIYHPYSEFKLGLD